MFVRRFVGLCADGQYLALHVLHHLAEQHQLTALLELWDEAHMLELIWKHALKELTDFQSVMLSVDKIIVDLCGPLYNKYLEVCSLMKMKALQPAVLKKLKFIKHTENQYRKFIKMMPVIKAVLESRLLELKKKKPRAKAVVTDVPGLEVNTEKKGKKAKKQALSEHIVPST